MPNSKWIRFKSPKERLKPVLSSECVGVLIAFQIPEGTFKTLRPIIRAMATPRFKSPKERLKLVNQASARLHHVTFQIPEGTFKTKARGPWLAAFSRVSNPRRNV